MYCMGCQFDQVTRFRFSHDGGHFGVERCHYIKYVDAFIIQLIDMIQNITVNAGEAASLFEYQSAQRKNSEPYLSSQCGKSPGPPSALIYEYTMTLQAFYNHGHTATIKQAQDMVREKFSVLITQSCLQKHLVQHCGLAMKKLQLISKARTSQETITKQKSWVMDIIKNEIDFSSCFFLNETGFNLHPKQTFETINQGKAHKSTGPRFLCQISLRRPQAVVRTKNRKLQGSEERLVGKIGTRGEHYKNNMQGKFLIMDNATPNSDHCDLGHHVFKYAIYPYEKRFIQFDVVCEKILDVCIVHYQIELVIFSRMKWYQYK
ncbi:hypothetical protein BDC45DRAFT_536449 [Circinella umbellata]|nr:hypothetical protein BDC45DRAFT_536449 [Circinella umbellata]